MLCQLRSKAHSLAPRNPESYIVHGQSAEFNHQMQRKAIALAARPPDKRGLIDAAAAVEADRVLQFVRQPGYHREACIGRTQTLCEAPL